MDVLLAKKHGCLHNRKKVHNRSGWCRSSVGNQRANMLIRPARVSEKTPLAITCGALAKENVCCTENEIYASRTQAHPPEQVISENSIGCRLTTEVRIVSVGTGCRPVAADEVARFQQSAYPQTWWQLCDRWQWLTAVLLGATTIRLTSDAVLPGVQ